jgi:hypothetical protein
MSKRDNLSDYFTDLYQGIKSKKPDASRNPQDFRSEIERIKTGDDVPPFDGTIEIDGVPATDYTDYYDKGKTEGIAEGFADGKEAGIAEGFADGKEAGIAEGYQTGYTEGESEGYGNGYIAGEADGKADGYANGYTEGNQAGYIEGKQAEYDAFWDAFQQNGERRNYYMVFRSNGAVWTPANFKPKYDIICEGDATQCFNGWEIAGNEIDLSAVLKRQGITLDTSKATNLREFFAYGYNFIGELPAISCASAGANTAYLFRGVQVTKIEKVIVTEQTEYTEWFTYCNNLAEIRFEGAISNDINFGYSGLMSKASIQDIMQHLSEITAGKTVTISMNAVNADFETSAGAHNGSTSEEWLALVNTRPNWTINLV